MTRAAVMLMLFAACSQPAPQTPPAAATQPAAPVTASNPAPDPPAANETEAPRVIFPDGFVVNVEVVADPELRAQGLMYRDHLRPGTGMLFFFPEDGEYGFWMKNTLIPLDMIWIDSNQRVAHVKFNVPPCQVQDCPSYAPNATARYVLEVAGGVAQAHGIKAGDQLRFVGTEGVVAR
jgi:hypothetical protein